MAHAVCARFVEDAGHTPITPLAALPPQIRIAQFQRIFSSPQCGPQRDSPDDNLDICQR